MPNVSEKERLRAERDKERFLANELIAGLRGNHDYHSVLNVMDEIDEAEYEGDEPQKGKHTFTVLGGHRGSKWRYGSPVLVVSTFYAPTIAEATPYNIILTEYEFEQLRGKLKVRGLACGLEHFYLTRRKSHPLREKPCDMCELLASGYQPFIDHPDGWRRNREKISEKQAEVAIELYRAARVAVAADVFSRS